MCILSPFGPHYATHASRLGLGQSFSVGEENERLQCVVIYENDDFSHKCKCKATCTLFTHSRKPVHCVYLHENDTVAAMPRARSTDDDTLKKTENTTPKPICIDGACGGGGKGFHLYKDHNQVEITASICVLLPLVFAPKIYEPKDYLQLFLLQIISHKRKHIIVPNLDRNCDAVSMI